jgi:3-oxoacyl-[acyl-carrier-protein] synthase-3
MTNGSAVDTVRPVVLAGTGSYVPERVLTNAELEKMVDTTDEWIVTRSGIRERRIARDDEPTSSMAAEASRRALAAAGVPAEDVDLILVGTVTPDMVFPNTACFVQNLIGARRAVCFDLEAACSGFLFSLETARRYIGSGACRTALVIGAEKLSCVTDWKDRATCVLFGDGAGAVVLQAGAGGTRGIRTTVMGSDGSLTELLNLPGGGSRFPASHQSVEQRLHYMKMSGREVFKHAVKAMADAAQKALQQAGLTLDQVACIVPHQANARIIEAIADRLGAGKDRVYMNLDRFGNMSAASIPVALDEAVRVGRVKRGDLVLLVAFGGGFTWGATVVEL